MKNTGLRGDSAVLFTAAKLSEAKIIVLQPLSECLSFDLVTFDNVSFNKLQVKRAYPIKSKGKYRISLRRITMTSQGAVAKKYSKEDTDFVIGVIIETGDVYCIPISIAANRNSITLNPENINSKFVTNKKSTNVEEFKNKISLNNVIYTL